MAANRLVSTDTLLLAGKFVCGAEPEEEEELDELCPLIRLLESLPF